MAISRITVGQRFPAYKFLVVTSEEPSSAEDLIKKSLFAASIGGSLAVGVAGSNVRLRPVPFTARLAHDAPEGYPVLLLSLLAFAD